MKRFLALAIVLAACGDNTKPGFASGDGGTDGVVANDGAGDGASDAASDAMPDAHENLQCTTPMPPEARQESIVVAVPSDVDPSVSPTPTTRVAFTVLLPSRCPGDQFPLVMHSHGYGGSRITALAADGTLHPDHPHFGSIDELVAALPYHGYAVVSFDERGHGESKPANGGGYARIIDPLAETADARAILDWAYDHADELTLQKETAVAKDLRVGTIGYSYGGGYQFPLAALDARIDTIVPNGTWHHLMYSLMPGDTVKLAFDGLLCLLATASMVQNTPIVQTMCNQVGFQSVTAGNNRSRSDLAASTSGATASPRAVTETELVTFFTRHGMGYFRARELANQAWGFGETTAHLRPVPALLLQGNRDVLFNLTEAIWNQRYFAATGADVRLLSTEGGHMNPLASQIEGTANCGATKGVEAILAWFDYQLKGQGSIASIPKVCISLDATSVYTSDHVDVGSTTARLASGSANVPIGTIDPVFVPVTTISGSNHVLAGVPTIGSITVTAGTGALQSTNAFVGVGIKRGTTTILVDDQVTGFAAGTHTKNRNVNEDNEVWLPAVGEKLLDGDQVGLLFYAQHVQYAAVVSAEGLSGAPGVINYVGGTEVPPVTSGLAPGLGVAYVNPYSATFSNVALPIH